MLELGNGRGNLQAHVEDLLLALKADICGPAHHARHVALGLDVLTDAIVAGALLDERVLPQLEMNLVGEETFPRTLAGFLLPALLWGNGAGAAFFPLGGILKMCRGCHRAQKPLANAHSLIRVHVS